MGVQHIWAVPKKRKKYDIFYFFRFPKTVEKPKDFQQKREIWEYNIGCRPYLTYFLLTYLFTYPTENGFSPLLAPL